MSCNTKRFQSIPILFICHYLASESLLYHIYTCLWYLSDIDVLHTNVWLSLVFHFMKGHVLFICNIILTIHVNIYDCTWMRLKKIWNLKIWNLLKLAFKISFKLSLRKNVELHGQVRFCQTEKIHNLIQIHEDDITIYK